MANVGGGNSGWRGALLGTALALGVALPAAAQAPTPDLIARGKYLTDAGDCMACHTGDPAKPFAGGLPINTPFGVIYSPNITPDKDTGIGTWSDADFLRALHQGIGKAGQNLYPVFPFPWYTKVSDADVLAIKAYLFTLPAIHAPDKGDKFGFPFNIRTTLDGWKLLFFKDARFTPDPKLSAQLNRGAYLVQGLGHCAECHTQLNLAGAPEQSRAMAGGNIDGWYAPNITSDVRNGVGAWTQAQLVSLLKTGAADGKGVVVGPMAQVVHESLSKLSDEDLNDIAAYLKTVPAKEVTTASTAPASVGGAAYVTNCASCHQLDGRGVPGQIPALAGNPTVLAGGPQDVIRVMLAGLQARDGYGPMPSVGADLSDQDLASIANYVRTQWGNTAPADATAGMVSELRPKSPPRYAATAGSCPMIQKGDYASQVSQPGSDIAKLMHTLNDTNLITQVGEIAERAHKIDPKASVDDRVNGLTAAYCPIVAADAGLQPTQKRWRLERFSQLVYGDLVNPRQD